MVRRVCCVLIVLAVFLPRTPLLAQAGAGTLAGAVLDPDGKAVVAATLVIRNETTGDIRTTATDAGRPLLRGRTPGRLLRDRGAGARLRERAPERRAAGRWQNRGNHGEAERRQHHRDGDRVRGASGGGGRRAVAGVADRALRAVADQQRVHPELHVAGFRLQPGAADGAGHVQRQRQRPGPRRHQDVLPRLQRRPVQHDLRRHPVQRHQRSDAPLVGVLSGADDRLDRLRSQPGIGVHHRTVDLRRIGQPDLAIAELRSAAQRDGVVRLVQHTPVRRRLQHRPVRRGRQVAPDVRRARDAVGRLPDVQLPAARRVLGEISATRSATTRR